MVANEYRTGLYICLPLYLVMMAIVAFGANERMTRLRRNDALSAHFLGGRDFGPWNTAGTFFASLYSGYTVVGAPNFAYLVGFSSFVLVPSMAVAVSSVAATGIRLRKASVVRNHQSPVDFITDRFQSQMLRYVILGIQVVSSIIYLSAQVNSLKSTFNFIFGLDPEDPVAVIIMMIAVLLFEWMGGLSSVALTDSVQGLVMLSAFVTLPIVIKVNFGGWADLDISKFPRPDFYQTPSSNFQWIIFQQTWGSMGFFALPHLVQRVYAARDLNSLRTGWTLMVGSPWVTMFVGVFLGTMGVQILADAGQPLFVSNPFAAILEQVMQWGTFPQILGTITFTAALAAIMSTSDSLMIALSHLITAEVLYPMWPQAPPKQLAKAGRIVSLVSTILSLLVGTYWRNGIATLAQINFPVAMQAMPAFIVGLYGTDDSWNMHPWSLAISAYLATAYVIVTYFTYLYNNPASLPLDMGVTGLVVHLVLLFFFESYHRLFVAKKDKTVTTTMEPAPKVMQRSGQETFVASENSSSTDVVGGDLTLADIASIDNTGMTSAERHRFEAVQAAAAEGRPAWDVPKLQRFGEKRMTRPLLRRMMTKVHEPFCNSWLLVLLAVSITLVNPLVAEGQPAFAPLGGFITPPATIRGLPWWFFKQLILAVVPFLAIARAVWQTPRAFVPVDRVQPDGYVDADVVEMNPAELGNRTVYDGRNELIYQRRQAIRKEMESLGYAAVEEQPIDETETAATDPLRKRLRTLVHGGEGASSAQE